MTRLRKRDAEAMLALYDGDPVAALTTAMRLVMARPDTDFPTLVRLAPFDEDRRTRLLAFEVDALDGLARELNELRSLASVESPDGS